MGFNVDNIKKIVTVDHSHNNFSITSVKGNPIVKTFSGLIVSSIFKRTKAERSPEDLGDNSPMIYALKGLHGLSISNKQVSHLLPNAYEIANEILAQRGNEWDYVIPMPSSHEVANILALRISRKTSLEAYSPDVLKKITCDDMREQIKGIETTSRIRSKLNQCVKRFAKKNGWDSDFQIKSITPRNLRKLVNPLIFSEEEKCVSLKKILLVDDMVTSGTTLKSARNLLQAHYPGITIEAMTIFSTS